MSDEKQSHEVQLATILDSHRLWLAGDGGKKANLSGANLSGANLSGGDLSGANLSGGDLSGANLRWANLRGANLYEADLSRANLYEANLRGADLSRANLYEANLRGANLSQTTGLLDPIDYLLATFERDAENRGLIAYKTFGSKRQPPVSWQIGPGSILSETVNADRCVDCACGVNVSTLDWQKRNGNAGLVGIWRVLIRWEWLAGVVVPYHTDGKIRCSRVELLERVEV